MKKDKETKVNQSDGKDQHMHTENSTDKDTHAIRKKNEAFPHQNIKKKVYKVR